MMDIRNNFDDDRNFVQKYGWHAVILFITIYYLRKNVLNPILNERERKKNYEEATDPDRVARLREEMKRVREEQQHLAQVKSEEAKEKRKEKMAKRLKDSAVDQPWKTSGGRKLGTGKDQTEKGSSASSTYNPLMPSSGHMRPSYRPTRRQRPGGGG